MSFFDSLYHRHHFLQPSKEFTKTALLLLLLCLRLHHFLRPVDIWKSRKLGELSKIPLNRAAQQIKLLEAPGNLPRATAIFAKRCQLKDESRVCIATSIYCLIKVEGLDPQCVVEC
jgi:hypothetical protein